MELKGLGIRFSVFLSQNILLPPMICPAAAYQPARLWSKRFYYTHDFKKENPPEVGRQ
jgi:hypothetical protein